MGNGDLAKPTPVYLSGEGLAGDDRLIVPVYQRPYSWGPAEIRRLLDEMADAFQNEEGKPYYLGTVSLHKPSNEDYYHIIDGQQRLATLTLVAAVLRYLAPDEGRFKAFLFRKGNGCRLSFATRQEEAQALEAFIGATSSKTSENTRERVVAREQAKLTDSAPEFGAAVECIRQFFAEEEAPEPEPFARWGERNIVFFAARIPRLSGKAGGKEQSLYQYYDAVNVAGEQLRRQDILKARLLHMVDDSRRQHLAGKWETAMGESSVLEGERQTGGDSTPAFVAHDSPPTLAEIMKSIEGRDTSKNGGNANRSGDVWPPGCHFFMGWDLIVLCYFYLVEQEGDCPESWNSVRTQTIATGEAGWINKCGGAEAPGRAEKFIDTLYEIRKKLDFWFLRPVDTADGMQIGYVVKRNAEWNNEGSEKVTQNADNHEREDRSSGKGVERELAELQKALHLGPLRNRAWVLPALHYLLAYDVNTISAFDFLGRLKVREVERLDEIFGEVSQGGSEMYDAGTQHIGILLNMIDYALFCLREGQFGEMRFTARETIEHVIANQVERGSAGLAVDISERDALWNLALLSHRRNSRYSSRSLADKKQMFEDYMEETGYCESLRLYDIYCSGKVNFGNPKEGMVQVCEEHLKALSDWKGRVRRLFVNAE